MGARFFYSSSNGKRNIATRPEGCQSREIDFAVLDVDIAGEDVYPIAELLLQRGVPFVFHTGHGSRAHLTQLFPAAVTLMKPTPTDELIGLAQRMGR